MAWRSRLAIGTLAVAVLSSCGGAGTAPQQNLKSPYAVFTGSLHLAGEIGVDGKFTDAITGRGETCGEYAEGRVPATTLWVTPTPNNAEIVDGHTVSFTAGVAGSATTFHGPGVYTEPDAQVNVLLVDNSSFLPGDHPKTVITVTSSGSGSMIFSGMVDSISGQIETGGETWTCSSAPASGATNPSATQSAFTTHA